MGVKNGLWDKKKEKHAKAEEFVKEMKKIHKNTKVVLKKYTDRNRKEVVEYKVGDKVLLSTKNLMWQIRNKKIKKLIEKFIKPYKIKKIILESTVKLESSVSM